MLNYQKIQTGLLGVGLSGMLCLGSPLWVDAEEPREVEILKDQLAGDQAYLIGWLALPDQSEQVNSMHQNPEIQAIAERMPRAQAQLKAILAQEEKPTAQDDPPGQTQ